MVRGPAEFWRDHENKKKKISGPFRKFCRAFDGYYDVLFVLDMVNKIDIC